MVNTKNEKLMKHTGGPIAYARHSSIWSQQKICIKKTVK